MIRMRLAGRRLWPKIARPPAYVLALHRAVRQRALGRHFRRESPYCRGDVVDDPVNDRLRAVNPRILGDHDIGLGPHGASRPGQRRRHVLAVLRVLLTQIASGRERWGRNVEARPLTWRSDIFRQHGRPTLARGILPCAFAETAKSVTTVNAAATLNPTFFICFLL